MNIARQGIYDNSWLMTQLFLLPVRAFMTIAG
jgi:hypothetical protein